MYCGGDDLGAVVADFGTFSTKIGFAGDDYPRSHLSSSVGVPSYASGEPKSYQFDIAVYRENMGIENMMVDGLINDWAMFERMWEYAIQQYLKINPAESPVLLAEKSYNPSSSRQRICEIMFEKFGSPALFLSKDSVLNCYSVGRTTGLVIDVGYGGSVVAPVLDGWVDSKGIGRALVGGRMMDAQLSTFLKRRLGPSTKIYPHFRLSKTVSTDRLNSATASFGIGVPTCSIIDRGAVHPTYDAYMNLDLMRDIRESVCRMAESTVTDGDPKFSNLPAASYELPDGTAIDLGIERFVVPELLCDWTTYDWRQPDAIALGLTIAAGEPMSTATSSSVRGLPQLALDCIRKCDADCQTNLLSNIIVAGGGSSMEGTPDRIKTEIEQHVHSAAGTASRVKMLSAGNADRAISCWLGGSILASLGSFHEMWMTKADYNEFGAGVVDRKCP